ncbi:M20/M25/M40 family metallo-hydrolase [Candidatus Woesebacteria bacterium]|nr:MAG: M20/M25/M40 family metallo-hydrolase [Candidatus Woesebacteria bacterium]
MNKIIDTFCDLVRIDSPSGHEEEIRKYITNRLTKLDVNFRVDEEGNVFAKIGEGRKPVVLSCHMDTVEPGRGIKPVVNNGIITSGGKTILGADNKVCIAAILETLDNLQLNHRPLELVFSVREETDSGISKFDFRQLHATSGIVADSSSELGTIITASPWITDLKMEFVGKLAHSSIPEKGRNVLIPTIDALSLMTIGRVDKLTTCNIGLIKGGTATNTIPGSISIEGEIRSFSFATFNETLVKTRNVFEAQVSSGVKLIYEEKPYSEGYRLAKNDRCLGDVKKAFAKLGIKPKYKNSFGGSDANAFIKNGIKVINIGDGSKDAHTTSESVEISKLIQLGELYNAYVSINT